ncbi:MAG: 3-methylornithine--L-lysine ligase PylC [Synergistaceae bacterium]|jgi:pyrrolysine biosynthesis protein PylC|nr:3-methylornithine--L-lysine ligase PylC [Synergistaceae bacterium]
MRIAIIGGKLQGVEAAYLARAAGYHSVVIDRDQNAPASGLCDTFILGDALDREVLRNAFEGADAVLPAIEDDEVLEHVSRASGDMGLPFLHDGHAYGISSSKLESDRMFAELGIPAPLPWPRCGFPLIGKPSGQSGSQGVRLIEDAPQLDEWTRLNADEPYVLQQHLPGPSYSLEVVGNGEGCVALQVTELFMDESYDCCRVAAPALLAPGVEAEFREISTRIARRLKIKGVFDVEIILHDNKCKVLEIDARLPSQTPAAVYHSTGVNLLEVLCRSALEDGLPQVDIKREKAALYQHIYVDGRGVTVLGEHIMGTCGPLHLERGFLGADMAMTNWRPGVFPWAATLIYEGETRKELIFRQEESIRRAEWRGGRAGEFLNQQREG